RPPYQGPSMMAILLQHREGPIPSLRAARGEVSPALDQVFRRMVAKKPEERFASMADVVGALEALALAPEPQARQPVRSTGTQTAAPTPTLDFAPGSPDTSTAPVASELSNQTVDAPPPRPHEVGSMTVLLVEPSRSQAVIIRGYLQKLGF